MRRATKFASLLMAVSMTVSLMAGCGGTDNSGQTGTAGAAEGDSAQTEDTGAATDTNKEIFLGVAYDASSLDPGMASDDGSTLPVQLITEPLFRLVNGEAQPGIAESYETNEDSSEWTFHLRESSFSDGTPVTAEVMKYSILRMLNPENALDKASFCDFITGADAYMNGEAAADEVMVEAVDEMTLKITCDRPVLDLEFATEGFVPVDQTTFEAAGTAYGSEADNILTNGPFKVSEWTHDSELVLVKNENYWNAAAINLDGIHLMVGASGDTAVDMMLTGALDVASFSTQVSMDAVLSDSSFDSMVVATGSQYLHLNHHGKTEETGKWLSNENFRKALSAAIDRDALVAAVYTTDVAASSFIADTEKGVDGYFNDEFDTGSWSTAADPAAAQEYLAAAMEELGAADVSELPTFTMLAFDSEGNVTCLNAVADMWLNTLGIQCELDMEPISEMINKAYSEDYDFWKGGGSPDTDALDSLADYSASAGIAGMEYEEDAEYEALYQTALNAVTWADRKQGIADCAAHFTEHMMDLVVTWNASYFVYNKNITGIAVNGYDADFTYADINQ